jgi:hypothetical protein
MVGGSRKNFLSLEVLNEPEPEWKVVAHKRKKDRRSKEKEGNAADICGSAVASSAHKK